MTKTQPSVVEILRAGKAAIERKGWNQGFPYQGRICAFVALPVAGPSADVDMTLYDQGRKVGNRSMAMGYLERAMEQLDPKGWETLKARGMSAHLATGVLWNDVPGRTVAQVFEAYDLAIHLAESGT